MPENLDLSKLRFPSPHNGNGPAVAVLEEVMPTVPELRSGEPVTEPSTISMSLTELYRNFNVVDVLNNGAILATQRAEPIQLAEPDTNEQGYAMVGGSSYYAGVVKEEYNWNLRGIQGLKVYDEMRRSDAQVRSSLRVGKTPVLDGKWYVKPASQSAQDKEIAEFVEWNLIDGMTTSWTQVLIESLLMLDFGYYYFEKVFYYKEWRGKRRTCWRKFAPRHPVDTEEMLYDRHGGLQAIVQLPNAVKTTSTRLNIEDLLVFTFDKEAGNAEGISLLRSAYQSWYFKKNLYKIDAIQKERHGIGIPLIILPEGFQPEDRTLADQMGRNLRSNEKAHVVLPPRWDIKFIELHGNPVDVVKSIEHHDLQIAKNVLAGFLNDTSGGSNEAQNDIFLKGSRYIAMLVRDVINKYAIPELVGFNWKVDVYPKLMVRRIGETVDWRTLSMALRNLIGAGIIIPDEVLEAWARIEMDLPDADMATRREVATPQNPGGGDEDDEDAEGGESGAEGTPGSPQPAKATLPRQSQAGNMRNRPGVGRGDTTRTA